MPVQNEDIANILEEIADLLAIQDANPFRVRAYRNAARTIRGLNRDLHSFLAQGKDLHNLPGIGDDLAGKITEILDTGKSRALEKLHRQIPHELEELLQLPGLGPKRVKALFYELGIKTLRQLEEAARAGRLHQLPGFGVKLEQGILQAAHARGSMERRFLLDVAEACGEPLIRFLRAVPDLKDAMIAGSYRRGRESVGDLDILATASRPAPVMDRLAAYDEITTVASKGSTRASVVLRNGLQVDLRVVAEESFGAALHYFTGSKAHNIHVRALGQKKGLKINEYGVFKGARRIAGATEISLFESVGLPYIPPELREDHGEIEAASGGLPELVELRDIRGDLHVHTSASDGQADLRAMVAAAKRRGLRYLAVTDHSRRLTVAGGLRSDAVLRQIDQIETLSDRIEGITVLKGIEVDILEDGRLDLPDAVLSRLDLVVAAVHSHFQLPRHKQTERLLRAMDSRCFSILAHPSGRLLLEREPCDMDMERIIRHARERGCFLELNSQPQRLDLADVHCQMAKAEGVLVSINSDAHREDDFSKLRYGVTQARRGWLSRGDVLNTRPLNNLRRLLRRTMS